METRSGTLLAIVFALCGTLASGQSDTLCLPTEQVRRALIIIDEGDQSRLSLLTCISLAESIKRTNAEPQIHVDELTNERNALSQALSLQKDLTETESKIGSESLSLQKAKTRKWKIIAIAAGALLTYKVINP